MVGGFRKFIWHSVRSSLRRKQMMRVRPKVRLLAARFTEVSNDTVVSGIGLSSQYTKQKLIRYNIEVFGSKQFNQRMPAINRFCCHKAKHQHVKRTIKRD